MIKVADLIAQLQELPQDAYVLTEGCDCNGPCEGATYPHEWKLKNVLEGNMYATEEEKQPVMIQCVLLGRNDYDPESGY